MDLPFSGSDFKRLVAKSPPIQLENRFAERNPVLNDSSVSVLSRPAMKKFAEVGTGPIRRVFSSPGVFDGDLFIWSGTNLYRMDAVTLAVTDLGITNSTGKGSVSAAATAPIGEVPAYLFFTDGSVLYVYSENGAATGILTFSSFPSNGDQVEINGTYYQYTTGSVDTGTPDGSSGNPWLVASSGGTLLTTDVTNLYNAINNTGEPGTDYSTALTAHTTVQATAYGAGAIYVAAIAAGTVGNAYTTTETGAQLAWGAATLQDGGDPSVIQVAVPDDVGAISVAHINSYIIVVPVQLTDIKGRFYWIQPGEKVIDPLDFATAERNPDGLHEVVVFGDLFWLLGQNTTEPWATTGDPAAPMERYQGVLFDRGSWEGTAIQVKDSLIVVDNHGGVFQIGGGSNRISTPDIEERIRAAIEAVATIETFGG